MHMNGIVIFFLLLSSLYAKTTDFSIIIEKPFNNALFDITQDYDRKISAIGIAKHYKVKTSTSNITYSNAFDYLSGTSTQTQNGAQIALVKVDSSAQITLNKNLTLTNVDEVVSILKTASSGYFIGGYTLNGSLIVLQLDATGNILFTKIFGTTKYDKMSKLVPLKDGGVLAVGSSTTSRSQKDVLFESGLGLNDIYITRFSNSGVKLWSKKYGTQNDDIGIDAAEADDGSLMILGLSSYEKYKDVLLMRIAENGDKIWLNTYPSQTLNTPYKILKLRDGNFLLSLSQQNELHREQIRLMKVDLQNNILLDKSIDTTYSSVLKDIKEFSDSKLIGVGYVEDAYDTDGLVMLLNNQLSLLSQDHYGDENFDMFNALTILDNSQIATAGIHTDKDSQESNMWIVKLNRDGTMAQKPIVEQKVIAEQKPIIKQEISKPQTIAEPSKMSPFNQTSIAKIVTTPTTSTPLVKTNNDTEPFNITKDLKPSMVYDELCTLFKGEIGTKKISIKKDLTIEFTDDSLYFQAQQYELTPAQEKFLERFSKKLIPFLTTKKANIDSLEINGHTSSEWAGVSFSDRYLKNEELSMKRAYAVMSYIFKKQNKETQEWLSSVLRGSGFSSAKAVVVNSFENRNMSRKVSFKIMLIN